MVSKELKYERTESILKESFAARESYAELYLEYMRRHKGYRGGELPEAIFTDFVEHDLETVARVRRDLRKIYPSTAFIERLRRKEERDYRKRFSKTASGHTIVEQPFK